MPRHALRRLVMEAVACFELLHGHTISTLAHCEWGGLNLSCKLVASVVVWVILLHQALLCGLRLLETRGYTTGRGGWWRHHDEQLIDTLEEFIPVSVTWCSTRADTCSVLYIGWGGQSDTEEQYKTIGRSFELDLSRLLELRVTDNVSCFSFTKAKSDKTL